MAFVTYNPASDSLASLIGAIYTGSAGATINTVTTRLGTPSGEASTISFYDGAIAGLNIGAGLMLTSGDPTPPTVGPFSGSYSVDTGTDQADTDLQTTISNAFSAAGSVRDLTYLQFHVNVTDAALTGLTFSVIFASEEYPEYSNSQFVDVAGVYVNGVNYALFGGSAAHPLSVMQPNIDTGNFINNQSGTIPIEYDGISVKLQVTAPIHLGDNIIKIAIADTGDSSYDSSIFVSGMQAVTYDGFGLSQQIPVSGVQEVVDAGGNQTYVGNALKNLIKLIGGQDVVDAGAGIDEVDVTWLLSNYTWNGSTLGLSGFNGNSTQLVDVERVELSAYPNILLALDTTVGGNAYGVMALFEAALNTTMATHYGAVDSNVMLADDPVSYWVSVADDLGAGSDLGDVAQLMLNAYAPGVSNEAVIALLYQNIAGGAASPELVSQIASLVGTAFAPTLGDLFATAALLPDNTADLDAAGFTGSILALDPAPFL